MITWEIGLAVNGRLLLQFGKSPQGTIFSELSLCCCSCSARVLSMQSKHNYGLIVFTTR